MLMQLTMGNSNSLKKKLLPMFFVENSGKLFLEVDRILNCVLQKMKIM